jgi:hypothetical protein
MRPGAAGRLARETVVIEGSAVTRSARLVEVVASATKRMLGGLAQSAEFRSYLRSPSASRRFFCGDEVAC